MEVQDRSLSQQQLDAYHRDGMVNRSGFSLLLRFPLRIGRKSACFLLNRPGSSTGRGTTNCCSATGFLVIEGFASPSEVAEVRQRAAELVEGFEPATRSVFSTKSQVCSILQAHVDTQLRGSTFCGDISPSISQTMGPLL